MNSRRKALLSGVTHYITGKPCVRGHYAQRFAASGNCVECMKENAQTEARKAYCARYRSTDEFRQTEMVRRSWPWVYEARRIQNTASRSTPKGRGLQREALARRRARKLNAPGSHTINDRRAILVLQGGRCLYCDAHVQFKGAHHDHYVPLTRGGSDSRFNIVMACATCNLRKHDKMPIEFAGFSVKLPPFWHEARL